MENVEDEEILCTPCQPNESCRTLLLTYSQADMDEVPYTATFAQLVLEACNEGTSSAQILKWAACQEPHADGGKHYHLIMKLNKTRKWKPIFNTLKRNWDINVNFSSTKMGYLCGYRYVTKDKPSSSRPQLGSSRSVKQRKKMSRMEVVFHFLDERCVEGCDGKWLESVREVLGNNKINIFTFADSMRKCLSIGR